MANANPGPDTIEIAPNLVINAASCPEPSLPRQYYIFEVLDSLTIEGNGATIKGSITWVTSGGLLAPLGSCPRKDLGSSDVITSLTPGFVEIGKRNQPNPGLEVVVKNLSLFELHSIATVHKDAELTMDGVKAERILAAKDCVTPAITADESNVTLVDNDWSFIFNWGPVLATYATSPAIIGVGGTLDIVNSQFTTVGVSGFINWNGGNVNIVSSKMYLTGGIITLSSGNANIVNSLWAMEELGRFTDADRIANIIGSGQMTITASTLLLSDYVVSPNPAPIVSDPGNKVIKLAGTAIGVNSPTGRDGALLGNRDGSTTPGGFTADPYVWLQPVDGQDADALKTLTGQPLLLTDPSGLMTNSFFNTIVQRATPLIPGVLIDVIEDANCGNTNELLNPIDGSCITTDVLGNPRWDGNEARDIGAIQVNLAPHLTVSGTGDGTVDLGWSKPQTPSGSTITGYELRYRETGGGAWTTISVSGPDTLTRQVTGLTNGTEYEFEVRAVYSPSGEGPWSNTATGTPFRPVDPPVVSATPGDGEVRLFWTEPDAGGHPGPLSYTVVYRPVGAASWIAGPAFLSGRTTLITGLTNGTEYEFGVFATATDGANSQMGTTTATPFAPGTITIIKKTTPISGGIGDDFSFSQDIDNSGDFILRGNGGAKIFLNVTPDSYTVTEADPQGLGYELTAIVCVDYDANGVASTVDVTTRTATINVDSGEDVTCFFTNSQEETVVIEKRTIPPGGSGFTFNDNIGTPNVFTLNDAQTRTFTHVAAGDYKVTEAAMPGYKLTAIDCTVEGQSVPGDLTSRTANISLQQPGGSAHCTFTNTQLGTLILRKETLPDGAPDAFGYTISGPDTNDSGSLTDGASTQVDNAQPGEWTLTESLPSADWHLGDISCTSTLGTSTFTKDIDNLKATVELAPGDTVDCTFTNVEDETITVEKVTVPGGDTTTDFSFTGSGSIGGFALKDGESQSFSVNAGAGPYTLTESDPSGAGYEVTDIRCVNTRTGAVTSGDVGTRSVELNTQPGESQHCTFTNERHGQVVIRKATAPAGDTTNSFGFYGSFGSFSLQDGEDKAILDVAPGAYSVSEVDPSGLGYGLSAIKCSDSDAKGTPSSSNLATHTATINVDAGETVECTFTNSKFDTLSVFKVTLPPGGTGFGFEGSFGSFTLDDGDLTSFPVSSGSYTVSEDDPTPGYDLAFILCYDASTGEFFEGDAAQRQVDLNLEEAHQIFCEFLNVQRGTIIIEKAPGAGTGYDFSGDLGDFTLNSGQERTFVELPVGQYAVSEQTPPGNTLTGLNCSDSDANGVPSTGNVITGTATINLDPGETVRCTYTNQPGASIVIKKAVDSGPSGPFTFLDNIQTPATFDLSHGEEQRFDGVLPGTYTVQESGFPNGSGLSNIDCVDSDTGGTPSRGDLSAATAVIHLDAGETVECTFTNAESIELLLPIIFRR